MKVVRFCLLLILVAAICYGIYYYVSYVQKDNIMAEGTLVKKMDNYFKEMRA